MSNGYPKKGYRRELPVVLVGVVVPEVREDVVVPVVPEVREDEDVVVRAGVALVETEVRVGAVVRDEVTVLLVDPSAARVVVVVVVLPVELIRVDTVVPGVDVAVARDEVELLVLVAGVRDEVELPVLVAGVRDDVEVLVVVVVVVVEVLSARLDVVADVLFFTSEDDMVDTVVLPLYVVVAAPVGFCLA